MVVTTSVAQSRDPPLGKLEKGLTEAAAKGWTVVDMKNEWKVIFPFEKKWGNRIS